MAHSDAYDSKCRIQELNFAWGILEGIDAAKAIPLYPKLACRFLLRQSTGGFTLTS